MRFRHAVWLLGVCLQSGVTARDLDHNGSPDILWRNKSTGENSVWIMHGTNRTTTVDLPSLAPNTGWKMAGSGGFNGGGWVDILWRNEVDGQNRMWLMSKDWTFVRSVTVRPEPDLDMQVVGTGDFNHDGKIDILWHHRRTGQKSVWLMDGTNYLRTELINAPANPDVVACAVGDFDQDGNPDIVVRHVARGPGYQTGETAVWFMKGTTIREGKLLADPAGGNVTEADLDWKVVVAADFDGDGNPDLLWRHATLGLNYFYFMRQHTVLKRDFLLPAIYDTDWRIAGQETAESTWRLGSELPRMTATVSTSPPSVTLKLRLPRLNRNDPVSLTIQRRKWPTDTAWTNLVEKLAQPEHTDVFYTDKANVEVGARYEYRVYRATYDREFSILVGVNAVPIETRGRIILLVEASLTNPLAAELKRLQGDLVGDGWSVTNYYTARHDDLTWTNNPAHIGTIKTFITNTYHADTNNVKAVFVIGHVPVPYSGNEPHDGHVCAAGLRPDHSGAWPADAYYGDMNSEAWTDNRVVQENCDFGEIGNAIGDGKFDNNRLPASLELSVGRVDFANLPALGQSEVSLLRRYLTKDHQYRHKQLPWQSGGGAAPEHAIYYDHFFREYAPNSAFAMNATKNSSSLLGDRPGTLVVGDFFWQRMRPYLLGYLAGSGYIDRINWAIPVIEHTSADLADPGREPTALIYVLKASFNGDWNLRTNNLLRCLISTPNYGLAAMSKLRSIWSFHHLGAGADLGTTLKRMMNEPSFYDPQADTWRELAILGDPTLRIHVLAPPSGFTGTPIPEGTRLTWTAVPGVEYHVYKSAKSSGAYARITPTPVSGGAYVDPDYSGQRYMIRALQLVTTGCGSYTNISQGAFWPDIDLDNTP